MASDTRSIIALSRQEAAQRLDPVAWDAWQAAKAACPPLARQLAGTAPLSDHDRRAITAARAAEAAAYAPLVAAVNTGALVAGWRPPDDPIYRPVSAPLPANWKRPQDLRFWYPGTEPWATTTRVEITAPVEITTPLPRTNTKGPQRRPSPAVKAHDLAVRTNDAIKYLVTALKDPDDRRIKDAKIVDCAKQFKISKRHVRLKCYPEAKDHLSAADRKRVEAPGPRR